MKIALCISGKAKFSMFCFPYMYDSFIKNNGNFDVDVFYHTWNPNERVINLWNSKKIITESEEISYIEILKHVYIEKDYTKQHDINRIYNNLLMYYGIYKIINEALSYHSYDIVIRIRPDLLLYEKIDLKNIVDELVSKKYDICIPNEHYNYSPDGYCDQFAIGTAEAMKIYSETYLNLTNHISLSKEWFSEEFLYNQLQNYKIKVHQPHIYCQLIRNIDIETNHKNIPPFKMY